MVLRNFAQTVRWFCPCETKGGRSFSHGQSRYSYATFFWSCNDQLCAVSSKSWPRLALHSTNRRVSPPLALDNQAKYEPCFFNRQFQPQAARRCCYGILLCCCPLLVHAVGVNGIWLVWLGCRCLSVRASDKGTRVERGKCTANGASGCGIMKISCHIFPSRSTRMSTESRKSKNALPDTPQVGCLWNETRRIVTIISIWGQWHKCLATHHFSEDWGSTVRMLSCQISVMWTLN